MSIALAVMVEELERRVVKLDLALYELRNLAAEMKSRLESLEQTAARKPGPKPKDSNG